MHLTVYNIFLLATCALSASHAAVIGTGASTNTASNVATNAGTLNQASTGSSNVFVSDPLTNLDFPDQGCISAIGRLSTAMNQIGGTLARIESSINQAQSITLSTRSACCSFNSLMVNNNDINKRQIEFMEKYADNLKEAYKNSRFTLTLGIERLRTSLHSIADCMD